MAVYLLLNLVTHNLLPRHMIAAVPIMAALLAIGLEKLAKARGWVFPLISANAMLLAAAATFYGLSNKRWETNVGRIRTAIETCPQSPVYALNAMRLLPPDDPLRSVPNIDTIFGMAYLLIADQSDFSMRMAPVAEPDWPGRCPTLLWIEHLYARPGVSDLELARIAGFTGPIRVARLQRGNARALLAISSADH
jgi:hypothetical protein